MFHPALYDWSKPVDSFWETERASFGAVEAPQLRTDETADVAIIGGGYCGMSAAYHLVCAGIDASLVGARQDGTAVSAASARRS
jgi:hypothetical protein